MENEKLLPKPLTDLPLPEKELSEHATPASQGQALQNQKTNILKSKFFWGFVAVSVLIAFLIGGIVLGKNYKTPKNLFHSLNLTPTITPTIETANTMTASYDPNPSKTLTSIVIPQFGISFKLPSSYVKISDTPESVSFGLNYKNGDKFKILTINNNKSVNVSDYMSCSLVKKVDDKPPGCINSVSYGAQNEDIKNLVIDNKKAISFLLTWGSDSDRHFVQLDEKPYLEFEMYIAGGGLEKTFQDFLTTIKFIN